MSEKNDEKQEFEEELEEEKEFKKDRDEALRQMREKYQKANEQ